MLKLRHLKARLSEVEYQALVARADQAGLTLSEFARVMLARESERDDQAAVQAEMRAQLAAIAAHCAAAMTPAPPLQADPDPLLVEVLWLLRELATERNAQALARVSSKLDAVFGRDRSRV